MTLTLLPTPPLLPLFTLISPFIPHSHILIRKNPQTECKTNRESKLDKDNSFLRGLLYFKRVKWD